MDHKFDNDPNNFNTGEDFDSREDFAPANESADGMLPANVGGERRRGRGAVSNASGRYEAAARIPFDDGWQSLDELPPFKTVEREERARNED